MSNINKNYLDYTGLTQYDGKIKECIPVIKELTGTLAANATSIELTYTESNPAVFNSSFSNMIVDIYTDKIGLEYTSLSQTIVTGTSVTFTIGFNAQNTATTVLIKLKKKV